MDREEGGLSRLWLRPPGAVGTFDEQRERYKRFGGKWDGSSKRWYVDFPAPERQLAALADAIDQQDWDARFAKHQRSKTSTGKVHLKDDWLGYAGDLLSIVSLDDLYRDPEVRASMHGAVINTENGLKCLQEGSLPVSASKTESLSPWEDFWRSLVDADGPPAATDDVITPTARILLGWSEKFKRSKNKVVGQPVVSVAVRLKYSPGGSSVELLPSAEGISFNPLNLVLADDPSPSVRAPIVGLFDDESGIPFDDVENLSWPEYWEIVSSRFFESTTRVKQAGLGQEMSLSASDGPDGVKFMGVAAGGNDSPITRGLRRMLSAARAAPKLPRLIDRVMTSDPGEKSGVHSFVDFVGLNIAGKLHYGSMVADFPLDPAQRLAVYHAYDSKNRRIHAVSGPPGTGKTAMLRSFVASKVVRSVVRNEPVPPALLATSFSNQATTNTIKAFNLGSEEGFPVGSLTRRWISGLPSLGWFMPAMSKKSDPEYQGYQLLIKAYGTDAGFTCGGLAEAFGSPVEPDADKFAAQRDHYDNNLRAFLGHGEGAYTRDQRIKAVEKLRELTLSYCKRQDSIFRTLAIEAFKGVTERDRRALYLAQERHPPRSYQAIPNLESHDALKMALTRHLDSLRSALSDLSEPAPDTFVGRIIWYLTERRSHDKALTALRQTLAAHIPNVGELKEPQVRSAAYDLVSQWTRTLEDLEETARRHQLRQRLRLQRIEKAQAIRKQLDERHDAARTSITKWLDLTEAVSGLFGSDGARAAVKESLRNGAELGDLPELTVHRTLGRDIVSLRELYEGGLSTDERREAFMHTIECFLDVTARHRAFHASMRYWEGRWILAAETEISEEDRLREGLRRLAMLAPMTVSTAHSAHRLLARDAKGPENSSLEVEMYDWIVIDEAGQMPIDLSFAVLSTAKAALVVGDVEQISPVITVPLELDRSYQRKHGIGVASHGYRERALSTGSMMKMALMVADHNSGDTDGVSLKFHYRCRDTIIEFCNRLVYNAREPLVPVVGDRPGDKDIWRDPSLVEKGFDADANAFLPPMVFLESAGEMRRGGGITNPDEAEQIAQWLHEYRAPIERAYGKAIEQVVAVLSPFRAQAELLKKRIGAMGIVTDKKGERSEEVMTVGTVHALQGSERPIVIFGCTASDPSESGFIDKSPAMLNVAVSRAQHSFVFFGSPSILRSMGGGPLGQLVRYLRDEGYRLRPRDLVIVESPTKAEAIQDVMGPVATVVGTSGSIERLDSESLLASPRKLRWISEGNGHALQARLQEHLVYGEKHVDDIVLATDDDRIGELIAWRIQAGLRGLVGFERVKRMRFYAIEANHLREARALARHGLDAPLIRAAITRECLNILAAAKGMGRQQMALLDLLAVLGSETKTTLSAMVEASCNHYHAVAGNEPLGEAVDVAGFEAEQHIGGAITFEPELLVRFREPRPGLPNTASVLAAALRHTDLDPGEISKALEELYLGRGMP